MDERQLFGEIQLAKSGGRQVARVEHTLNPAQIDPAEHGAIFYAGGHGTMWDFADNQELAGIGAIYEAEGIVGAVCHGLAALVNLNFQVGVVASERLVTGQNPASAAGVGHKMVELLKNKYIPKNYRTEKPGFLHNTFAPKSKCSKKVGWVEALVPKILDFTFLLPSKIANLKSFVGFAPLGFNLQGIIKKTGFRGT